MGENQLTYCADKSRFADQVTGYGTMPSSIQGLVGFRNCCYETYIRSRGLLLTRSTRNRAVNHPFASSYANLTWQPK